MPSFARARPVLGFVLNTTLADSYTHALWEGAVRACEAAGVDLVCLIGNRMEDRGADARNATLLSQLDADAIDGLVTINLGHERLAGRVPAHRKVPVASVQAALRPGVVADNRQGVRLAVQHLVEVHGRRRIAFVRGAPGDVAGEERFDAYHEALGHHGLPADPALVYQGYWEKQHGAKAVAAFTDERRVAFDAVVTANDGMALGVLEALEARGRAVPGEVSVVGFDDVTEAAFCTPALTTVRQPLQAMAARAVQLVLEQLRGRAQDLSDLSVLPTELVVRRSCGCFSDAVMAAGSTAAPAAEAPAAAPSIAASPAALADAARTALGGAAALQDPGWADAWAAALTADLAGGPSPPASSSRSNRRCCGSGGRAAPPVRCSRPSPRSGPRSPRLANRRSASGPRPSSTRRASSSRGRAASSSSPRSGRPGLATPSSRPRSAC
jgi:DNA-binding LacI/PurR family transcriptional regulator